ncbi:hypothetical protein Goarm_000325 [Gossypium armourianum]|uniref:CCHC-type domain-containing protein n=1 Tax=Gossypium armourianum TaxID=34283 RepID=A0A7J9K9P1_9ROSI|nr:hypothetical protein [Gossypium armourianum]
MASSLETAPVTESRSTDDRETKKVRFKEKDGDTDVEMVTDLDPQPKVSWKQMLGKGVSDQEKGSRSSEAECTEDFEFLEGDVKKTIFNSIPAIEFSDCIQQILFKDMETMVILKLLGRNIGYDALLSGLPGFMYKSRILEVIGELVGKVVKLDFNTDSKTRGRFARMAVLVDLDKPLVSQVLVNGELQRVEYEALPTICFSCGKYGHLKKLCASPATGKGTETGKISGFSEVTESTTGGEGLAFGP